MKATISLFLKKGFKKNLLDISIRFFLLLGGTFTVYQVLETFINVKMNGLWFLILLLALSLIAIIAVFIETRILLKKTFYLKDHYKITVDVDDYIDNAKKYPEAHLISGSNNEFNINFAKDGTLQRE